MAAFVDLAVVFGAVLGPTVATPAFAETTASLAPNARTMRALRVVGLSALVVTPLALVAPELTRLGFAPSAMGVTLALILLIGALQTVWGGWPGRSGGPPAAPVSVVLTPSGAAAILLLPGALQSGSPPRLVLIAVVAVVLAVDFAVLLAAERLRRWVGMATLRVLAWTVAVLVAVFAIQLMAHTATDLVCHEIDCPDFDDGPDPALQNAGLAVAPPHLRPS